MQDKMIKWENLPERLKKNVMDRDSWKPLMEFVGNGTNDMLPKNNGSNVEDPFENQRKR